MIDLLELIRSRIRELGELANSYSLEAVLELRKIETCLAQRLEGSTDGPPPTAQPEPVRPEPAEPATPSAPTPDIASGHDGSPAPSPAHE